MKIIIPFLILLLLFSACLFSQERGFKVVRTPQGKEIALYKGSYALVVGNGKYTAGWDELLGAVKDTEEIAGVLRRNGFEVTLVKNADKRTFLSELSNITYKYGQDEDNQLLFYYAGHGHTATLASGEELGMLVMVDAPLPEKDPQDFDSKSVDMKTIVTWALKMKSKHVLFMFDSCFSGSVLNLRERVVPKAISDAVRYPVRQFITAGRADEPVPDRSVFKQLFIDMLEKRVEEPIPDGYITGEELGLFLKNRVPEYNKFQHPQYGKIRDPNLDKGDFVFVLEEAGLGVQEEIPTPPKAEKLDLSSIEESAKRREEARRKWSNWQEQMESDSIKVKRIDQNPENTAEEKKNAWEAFLRNYKTDNPYSNKDEQLRQRATQRLKALSEEKPRAEMDADAFMKRGIAYDIKGQHDEAISDYTRAIEINPKNDRYYIARGNAYLSKGQYDEAISDYTRAIEIEPKYTLSYLMRGSLYEKKGLFDKAISDYTRVIEINPKDAIGYNTRGIAYDIKGQHDKAISDYTRVIEINPKDVLAYDTRGRAYINKGLYDKAISDYTRAIEINPKYVDAFIDRGVSYNSKGLYDKAISDFTRAVEINPKYALAYYNLGLSYNYKGLYDKAISDTTRAIEINPKNAYSFVNRGFSYNKKGLFDKAISDYTRAIEINPKYVDAFIDRGISYNNKGLYDEAISDYTRAIEINPKNDRSYIFRGLSYNRKGLYDKAISDFTRAIEINPKNALALYFKAQSCEKVGRINEALEAYKTFIQNAPPDKYASHIEKAKKKIRKLEK